ncbi:MAG: zinc metalloprotease HtpX [Gemmatimonadetes bacterium]|nr:zinc metalloprotease HtpX [Gemmatimonadota bacterium]
MTHAKLFFLMALLTALIVAVGGLLGGSQMMLVALVFAALMNFGIYWYSDKAVLRMYRAQAVTREQAPELYEMVDRLRRRAGLPMPTVAVAPSDQPNAFATGRSPDRAVVCFTRGILNRVPREELEGVTAHELAHIKNRDMLIGTTAATMAGAITLLSRLVWFIPLGGHERDRSPLAGIALLIVAPLAALLVHMAVSRTMEYRADRVGAEISGNPLGLAGALGRLEAYAKRIPMEVNPAAAHLCIVHPLRGGGLVALFRTHPPTEERVRRLEAMARRR